MMQSKNCCSVMNPCPVKSRAAYAFSAYWNIDWNSLRSLSLICLQMNCFERLKNVRVKNLNLLFGIRPLNLCLNLHTSLFFSCNWCFLHLLSHILVDRAHRRKHAHGVSSPIFEQSFIQSPRLYRLRFKAIGRSWLLLDSVGVRSEVLLLLFDFFGEHA